MKDNLYSKHATEFSRTRQSAWEGWERLDKYIRGLRDLKILDLGCGNGRFLKFSIYNLQFTISNYIGLDKSAGLLAIAKKQFSAKNVEFKKYDLEKSKWFDDLHNENFNLIVSLALLHHIQSLGLRKTLIDKAAKLLERKGLLIISFWQFKNDEKFFKSHLIEKATELEEDEFNKNSFWLKFGNKGAKRFCHHFEDKEIDKLCKNKELELVETFSADGRNKKMNKYVILRKI